MPDIKINSLEGPDFGCFLAAPSVAGPGLIVIHEFTGITDALRKLCDEFAKKGYIALCPDLFWRKPEAKGNEAMIKAFDIEAAVRDLLSTLGAMRKMSGVNGKVGAIGHGLGGRLAFLMSSRSDVDASVGYYPLDVDKNIDEVYDIRMPLVLHLAGLDKFMPSEKRARVLRGIAKNPVISAQMYENSGYGFATPGEPGFNKEAADLADERSSAFLAERLMS